MLWPLSTLLILILCADAIFITSTVQPSFRFLSCQVAQLLDAGYNISACRIGVRELLQRKRNAVLKAAGTNEKQNVIIIERIVLRNPFESMEVWRTYLYGSANSQGNSCTV